MQPSEKVALTAVSGQDTGANRCQRDARQSRKAVGGEEVLQQPEASWHCGTKSQKPTEAMVGTGHKANC